MELSVVVDVEEGVSAVGDYVVNEADEGIPLLIALQAPQCDEVGVCEVISLWLGLLPRSPLCQHLRDAFEHYELKVSGGWKRG